MSEHDSHENGSSGPAGAGSERWLITYADMITLLMVFFIVLYAMAEVDKAKYASVADVFRRVMGGGNMIVNTGGVGDGISVPIAAQGIDPFEGVGSFQADDPLEGIGRDLYAAFAHDGRFIVRISERGLVISLVGSAAFDSGQAEIRSEYLPVLAAIGVRLSAIPNDISVEGFTDSDPIHTPEFPSNWYLSTARASRVRDYLEEQGVSPERMILVGYGETRAIWSNDTPQGKARNRRVDVVILRDKQVIDLGREIRAGD